MIREDQHRSLVARVAELRRHDDAGGALQRVCILIAEELDGYDWVGFYIAVPEQRLLVLGPFQGEPTEHIRIAYGRGICGQSAVSERTFRVDDVAAQDNYLACSINVQSEMVVPVFAPQTHGRQPVFIGEVDIDSHRPAAFGDADARFLDEIAALCAPKVAELMHALSPGSA